MPFEQFGDLRLYFEDAGEGPPLFLLHGAAGSSAGSHAGWVKSAPRFRSSFRTIAVDTRGHGRSNFPGNRLTYREMADDVLALADRLHADRFHVAGMSDGAITGMDIAMRHPERLLSLVGVGCSFRNDHMTMAANAEWAGLWKCSDDDSTARKLSALHDHDKGHGYWRRLMRALDEVVATLPDYSPDDLRRITTPTLLIAGENDGYCNTEQLQVMVDCIADVETYVIPGGGHTVQDSHADEVTRVAMEFWTRRGF